MKPRGLWSLSGCFLVLTLAVAGWLVHEVGILGFTPVAASEKADPGIETLQRGLQEREAALKEKEEGLSRREAAMAEKERILSEQIVGYRRTIEDLRARMNAFDKKPEDKTDIFLAIYDKMDPKKAAAIFEKLDVQFAIRILGKMAPARAADILGAMSSERARLLTEKQLSSIQVVKKGGE